MIRKVIVLGGGSAGFLAAISLKVRFSELDVEVLLSRKLGIIGVGEGTTAFFPTYIHGRLQVDPIEFHRLAQPSWKLGIRFVEWGPRPCFYYTFRPQVTSRYPGLSKPTGHYCQGTFENADIASALMAQDKAFVRGSDNAPVIGADASYHIENEQFVAFLEELGARVGVQVTEGTVADVGQDESGITGLTLETGETTTADLYVDCSGFASVLIGRALGEPYVSFGETLFCDRAVVGGWARSTEPIKPYTTAEGMNAGWCWQIEHEHRINRGYVYSGAFISDQNAEEEFRSKNPKVRDTRIVRFVTGRYERAWVKNVVGIGNSCGFVEPLEATSLAVICDEADTLVKSLDDCGFEPTPTIRREFNRRAALRWDDIRDFLGVHYKYNTSFDTPFWTECRAKVVLGGADELVEYFRENGPGLSHRDTLLSPLNQFGLEGYWTLLIGQRVPYSRPHVPGLAELTTWHQIQESLKARAAIGIGIEEATEQIRSGAFQWPQGLYEERPFEAPV